MNQMKTVTKSGKTMPSRFTHIICSNSILCHRISSSEQMKYFLPLAPPPAFTDDTVVCEAYEHRPDPHGMPQAVPKYKHLVHVPPGVVICPHVALERREGQRGPSRPARDVRRMYARDERHRCHDPVDRVGIRFHPGIHVIAEVGGDRYASEEACRGATARAQQEGYRQ